MMLNICSAYAPRRDIHLPVAWHHGPDPRDTQVHRERPSLLKCIHVALTQAILTTLIRDLKMVLHPRRSHDDQ